jgi:hypothetical protein
LFNAKRDQIAGRTDVAASRAVALARNVLRVYTFTRFLELIARETHKCEAIFYAEQRLVKKRDRKAERLRTACFPYMLIAPALKWR